MKTFLTAVFIGGSGVGLFLFVLIWLEKDISTAWDTFEGVVSKAFDD